MDYGESSENVSTTFSRHSTIVGASSQFRTFSTFDYSIFGAMLVSSSLIGVYFAFFAKQKQNTASEYLMGGRTIGVLPIAMSLIARTEFASSKSLIDDIFSCISGVTFLGASAEMYTYGTQYSTSIIGLLLASIASGTLFMPVYCKLQLNTSYEYLELRFDRSVRLLGSVLFLINSLLYIPIVVYIPALALSQVSGINIHLITPVVCLICIFYTSLGGLKAVVWTDALQTVLMYGSMFAIVCIGTKVVGGFEEVWKRNQRSGRIEFFNLSPDPTVRHTFWNTIFGATFNWLCHLSVNQSMVQRFLAMPSFKKAQAMISIFTVGILIIYATSLYAGLVIYASYYNCDLISSKVVRAPDQVLPYFVMEVASGIPGLPGLFMAGVFSAALSSMSTGINSMAGVIYEDFVEPFMKVKVPEAKAAFIMKVIAIAFGVVCVGMVFVVENLGTVIQVSWSLGGVTQGAWTALFVLGMFFPWTSVKGTWIGGVTGLIVMGFICFGTQASISSGKITFEKKPMTTEGCSFLNHDSNFTMGSNFTTTEMFGLSSAENFTAVDDHSDEDDDVLSIFRLSYTLYTLTGMVISVLVGLVASALTGLNDPADVDIDLLTPAIHPLYADRCKKGRKGLKVAENSEVMKELDEVHDLLTSRKSNESYLTLLRKFIV
ncbi:hypothetical protein J437_LFUL005327 [Ladona fulva]|uniref:Sodium-coupled monocarboxylate transporter 1 n=1 Tax=Ladona fulva TaxID=123851 RepID=A0A8K0K2H4_LADFU|nr:hypothetical protein J437_LFUL005327 [Ladona fulva]